MRWSYKTVHYELKKEGLLGSAFLDESEMEQSLNEYGKAGWELISLLETLDGLIAVFKQPLSLDTGSFYPRETTAGGNFKEEVGGDDVMSQPEKVSAHGAPVAVGVSEKLVLVDDYEVVDEFQETKEGHEVKLEKQSADVGTIRIE